jgi:hypothetical protein
MRYKELIAFLGKNQMKDWARPDFSRFVMFNGSTWRGVCNAYPETWTITIQGRLKRVDSKKFHWYQAYSKTLYKQFSSVLGQESPIYIYDTKTESIIFNKVDTSVKNFENLYPEIARFIDSGEEMASREKK